MSKRHMTTTLLACLACFVLGSLAHDLVLSGQPAQPVPEAPVLNMEARLSANVYLQTSGEYRACCQQIYYLAAQRLQTIMQSSKPQVIRPAVVMDLDETVLDNSAFQTFLYRNKLEYTDALRDLFEDQYAKDVTFIPGAREFIGFADRLGVQVVFISNRTEAFRKPTLAILSRLGINEFPSECLYLRQKDGSSDKSARREAVAAKYNVLMYFGDNLRDFSDTFKARRLDRNARPEEYVKAIKERQDKVDEALCHWGVDWFVLPNPVYGEWDKLVPADPYAIMHPTTMKLQGK